MNISSVSIIIPAYNAEKYIIRCINSIVECNFDDYEIIVVNDGSKDNTLNIIKREAESNSNIKIYSIENSGVAMARNYGIEHSSKKWITFVDADDYLNSSLISKVQLRADVWNHQMIRFDIESSNNTPQLTRCKTEIEPIGFNTSERSILMKNTLGFVNEKEKLNIRMCVCVSTFYLASFLEKNKIRFPQNVKNGEDMIFSLRCLEHFESMSYIAIPFYVYYQNPDSLTHRYKPDMGEITVKFFSYLKPIVERNPFLYNQYFLSAVNNFFLEMDHFLFHPQNKMTWKQRFNEYKQIISNSIYRESFKKKYNYDFGGLNQIIYLGLHYHFYGICFQIYALKLIIKKIIR